MSVGIWEGLWITGDDAMQAAKQALLAVDAIKYQADKLIKDGTLQSGSVLERKVIALVADGEGLRKGTGFAYGFGMHKELYSSAREINARAYLIGIELKVLIGENPVDRPPGNESGPLSAMLVPSTGTLIKLVVIAAVALGGYWIVRRA